jgi:TonB family protein
MTMTLHQKFFEWFQLIWPFLANHLWQTTLIALIAWSCGLWLSRETARARYLVWMIAFVKFLVPSALLIAAIESCGFELSHPSTYSGIEILFQIAQPISPEAFDLGAFPTIRPGNLDGVGGLAGHSELYCLLTFIWLLGMVVWLARWLMLRWGIARVIAAESEVTVGRAAEALHRAKTRLSLDRGIPLIESSQVQEPGVWRIWRPIVVFPRGLSGKLSVEELEAVMIHELIHVSRRDNLLGTLQMLICCLFWFHPFVWLIDRKLLAEREMICDENVIRYIGKPDIYVSGLWKVAQFGLGWKFAGGSGAAGSNLKRRIEFMLDVKGYKKLSIIGRVVTGSTVAALLVIVLALAVFTRDQVKASMLPAAVDQIPKSVAQPENPSTLPPRAAEYQSTPRDEKRQSDEQRLAIRKPSQEQTVLTNQAGQVGGQIEPMSQSLKPTILYKEKAKYTDEARRNGLEGPVVLNVVFTADGSITNIQVYSGLPDGLSEKAIEAAKKIRFDPAIKDGIPVSVRGNLEFNFSLYKSADDRTSKPDGSAASETVHAMSASLRPTIIYKERADYTENARNQKIEGDVLLNVLFGSDGRIGGIHVVSGLPYGLTEAAIDAARRIRFEPPMKDGKPVSVRGNLEYHFKL